MNLSQVRKFALSLQAVTEEPHFHRTSFRVRGKIFVTADPKERFIHVFLGEQVREPMLAMHPDCLEKLLWGGKAVGLRVSLEHADSEVVRELVKKAWQAKAPKSMVREAGE
ncbi:MAG: MmcQ/YjbR family DNA-binding protein [Gammaproteobacteria bacterium]|nr:MmcQ/YjbR family DNA-binding protein [Gammaproteobacteria bacterium]MDH4316097.1 MmcQ/YjbR family DNA-binding protein [Gammaproteobacteria bacterium]MDH5215659.1 MmcQ/YjbR family DNA-binding protein [Gammaproteobacteria bacterium]